MRVRNDDTGQAAVLRDARRPQEEARLPRPLLWGIVASASGSGTRILPQSLSIIFVHDEPILKKKKAFSSPRLKRFRRGSGGRAPAMALDTPRTGTRPSGDGPRCTVNRDATPPGGLSGAERQVRGHLDELCDVFSPDSPLHDGLRHPSKAKPQVSSKQVGLF